MSRSGSSEPEANFLGRWARRKAQAKKTEQADTAPAASSRTSVPPGAEPPAVAPPTENPPEPIPPIESLQDDSDYSRFMAKDIGQDLRRLALRRLFQAPAFGIRDGLDDYDEDYTTFEKLGSTVTSDMRFHKDRLKAEAAREQAERDSGKLAEADSNPDQTPRADHEDQHDNQPEPNAQTGDEDDDRADHQQQLTADKPTPGLVIHELPVQRLPEAAPPVLAPRRQRLRLLTDDPEDAQDS